MKRQRQALQSAAAGAMRDFLNHHRALGKRFDTEEWALGLFDRYLVEQKVPAPPAIAAPIVEKFLTSRPRKVARSYNELLGVLRRWFNWLVVQGHISQSPLQVEPRRITGVRPPFLFEQDQVRRLLAVTAQLPDNPQAHQRGLVYSMIFALCYGLGLRVGEAARLRLQDVDWNSCVLTIHETKFAKSRLVPFGPKLAARLKDYAQQREARVGRFAPDQPLFCIGPDKSRSVSSHTVSRTFHEVWPKLGLNVPPGVAAPRLHCLRHSFAVGTLLRWYRQGIEPKDRLLHLSTFMGHAQPSSTAVYLTITADLLKEANQRFERFASPLLKGVTS
ncbi:MAG: tyrosine-type recombinase/integrase [Verrucomicrobia bacterium]|nr:tyrosine-type recombinase/integrase [Verrucomicrobiota bacterium]